jgi:hypothetical protein
MGMGYVHGIRNPAIIISISLTLTFLPASKSMPVAMPSKPYPFHNVDPEAQMKVA